MRVVVPVSWMERVDTIVYTVQCWFLLALPLLLSTKHLLAMLDARRNDEHASNIPAPIVRDGVSLSVLAFSTAISMFCVQCVRVIWPRIYGGECHSAISKTVANEWRFLVDVRRYTSILLFFINLVMLVTYYLFMVRITV